MTIFDKVDESEISKIELQVEQGLPEWREHANEPKKFQLGLMGRSKSAIADLAEVSGKEINKLLLDDLHKITGDLEAEELFVAISLLDPLKDKTVRNLVVYGFEKVEAKRFTSNPDVMMLRMEVNQEDDFVDLI